VSHLQFAASIGWFSILGLAEHPIPRSVLDTLKLSDQWRLLFFISVQNFDPLGRLPLIFVKFTIQLAISALGVGGGDCRTFRLSTGVHLHLFSSLVVLKDLLATFRLMVSTVAVLIHNSH